MTRETENKIILVRRETRIDDLIKRFNTIQQAKFYIEHLGADFTDYLDEHENYNKVIARAKHILDTLGRVQVIDRAFLPNFIFGKSDLVIAIGQDGLIANTLKYLPTQFLIGVNPDKKRFDGILLPFQVDDLQIIVPEVFKNTRKVKEISIAKASLQDGQTLYAVNDFFIGQKTHVSARYQIQFGSQKENQSSSGIIVSTGLGSTGWLKSILTGAAGISNNFMDKKIKLNPSKDFAWDSDYIFFTIREPFPSKVSQTNLIYGKITNKKPLKILSQMPENGVIFSDGIEKDFINFNSGMETTIITSENKGKLVI
ncbi:MAG: hypothetical protein ACD_79C00224G0005 [uncultured bacterium]|nr:MAG: hypothetical protein ACD_79C00224G0005 [uncultured bacterium]